MTEPREDEIDRGLEQRLARAFDSELLAARSDIERRPLRPAHRSPWLRVAVTALVVVVAISGGLAFRVLDLTEEPGTPPDLGSGLMSDRNDVPPGMPVRIGGESVLTVPGAIRRFAALEDDTAALVGGWLQQFEGYCDDHPLTGCSARMSLSSEVAAPALWVHFDGRPQAPTGWVVVKVHTHDKRASACAPSPRADCEQAFVVDDLEWSQPSSGIANSGQPSTPPPTVGPAPTPSATTGPSPTTLPAEDPIPRTILGLPVVRIGDLDGVLAVLEPAGSFILGGWVLAGCGDGDSCVDGTTIASGLGRSDPSARLSTEQGVPALQSGPTIVQVRQRSSELTCPPPCLTFLTLERVLWQEANDHLLPRGAPARVAGEPVLTVSEGNAAIDATGAPAPFLVGGWFQRSIRSCPTFAPDGSPLISPCDRKRIAAEPSPDPSSTPFSTADLALLDGGLTIPTDGAVVLRVHAHDRLAADCSAAERAMCERTLVVDGIVWTDESPVIRSPSASPSPTPTPVPSVGPIPSRLFGRSVLRPSEAERALPGLQPGSTLVVGGFFSEAAVTCGVAPPCPRIGSISDDEDPSSAIHSVKIPDGLALGDGRVAVVISGGAGAVTIDRVLWREDAPFPPAAPRSIDGPLVLTVSEAIVRAESATDETPFLVVGWFRAVPRPCPVPLPGTEPTSPLIPQCSRNTELDEKQTPPGEGARLPAVDIVFLDAHGEPPAKVPVGPVVLQVHVHDSSAAGCPPGDRATCERQLVFESVAWDTLEVVPTPGLDSPPSTAPATTAP